MSDRDAAELLSTGEVPWRPFMEGVDVRLLHADQDTGCWTVIARIAVGASLPARQHLCSSELLVLSGSGTHATAGPVIEGNYLMEEIGSTVNCLAAGEGGLEVYMVNFGPWALLREDTSVSEIVDVDSVLARVEGE